MANLNHGKRSSGKAAAGVAARVPRVLEVARHSMDAAAAALKGATLKPEPGIRPSKYAALKINRMPPKAVDKVEIRQTLHALEKLRMILIAQDEPMMEGVILKPIGFEAAYVVDAPTEKLGVKSKRPRLTAESVAFGEAFVKRADEDARADLANRIENRELVQSGELQEMGGLSRQAISSAKREERLFSMTGPSGREFYPAFYADPRYDRRKLGAIIKALGAKPASSKYWFFTTQWRTLDEMTPLQAMLEGRYEEVMATAAEYVAR